MSTEESRQYRGAPPQQLRLTDTVRGRGCPKGPFPKKQTSKGDQAASRGTGRQPPARCGATKGHCVSGHPRPRQNMRKRQAAQTGGQGSKHLLRDPECQGHQRSREAKSCPRPAGPGELRHLKATGHPRSARSLKGSRREETGMKHTLAHRVHRRELLSFDDCACSQAVTTHRGRGKDIRELSVPTWQLFYKPKIIPQ